MLGHAKMKLYSCGCRSEHLLKANELPLASQLMSLAFWCSPERSKCAHVPSSHGVVASSSLVPPRGEPVPPLLHASRSFRYSIFFNWQKKRFLQASLRWRRDFQRPNRLSMAPCTRYHRLR